MRPLPVDEHGVDVAALAGAGLAAVVAHPGPPVPDRRGAGRGPAAGAGRLDPGRRPGHRGRLRRRAPLRPATGRGPAGDRARRCRTPGQRVQDAGTRTAARLAAGPGGTARRADRAQALVGHHQSGPGPARARAADHLGQLRPAPAAGPQPAAAAPRRAVGRAGPAPPAGAGAGGGRRAAPAGHAAGAGRRPGAGRRGPRTGSGRAPAVLAPHPTRPARTGDRLRGDHPGPVARGRAPAGPHSPTEPPVYT